MDIMSSHTHRGHTYSPRGIRGEILTFAKDPFTHAPEECVVHISDGLIIVGNGKILDVGDFSTVSKRWPEVSETDIYSDCVITAGFIDCHAHYVQSPMIGSYGDTLLQWLNEYAFPTEAMFRDKGFAAATARVYLKALLNHGTTTANVFCTTFPESVEAFFEESERINTRMISGKVLQDRNLPDYLKDRSADESVEISRELMKKWHGRGRQLYAVIPRFAPTSTPRQLTLAGEMYQENLRNGVYLHTHLDEDEDEIKWVRELFPDASTYTDVYRRFGMLGARSVMAHCCIVSEGEWQMLHNAGCSAIHCPSSNLFLGDGEFKWWEAKGESRQVKVGIGTDVGGGTNYSVLRQLGEAYKVGMLGKKSLDSIRLLYMATRGGADALSLVDKIGTLAPGYEADITVIDFASDSFTAWRMNFCKDIFSKLFVMMTLGIERSIRATYVAGRKVYDSKDIDIN